MIVKPSELLTLDELDESISEMSERIARFEAENARLREALSNIAMYCESGFIVCPRCSEEVPTKDMDAEYEARAALKETDQ